MYKRQPLQRLAAFSADAFLRAVLKDLVADTGGLSAARADNLHLAGIDGGFGLDDTDQDLIGHKLAALHIGFGLQAHLCAALQRFTENPMSAGIKIDPKSVEEN